MVTSETLDYNAPQSIKAFLNARTIGTQKRFGQNFLINPQSRAELVSALDLPPGSPEVWEVGSGLGAMTKLLLESGAVVQGFEVDRGFAKILSCELFCSEPRFRLIEGDVLKTWEEKQAPGEYFLGNLPYTIAAKLVGNLIEKKRLFKRMVFVVQKEVAERAFASPGTKNYSSFSVLCASAYVVSPLKVLKPSAFYPRPHVDSQGLRLDLRANTAYAPLFYPLVRALFLARRKTIKNNLQSFLSAKSLDLSPEYLLASCRLKEKARAEELGVEDFALLAEALTKLLPIQ